MKSLRLVLSPGDEFIHPMHQFVCESSAMDREVLLEGKVEDGTRTLLFYVEGDRGAYEAALRERLAPDTYDITATDADGFTLYVRGPNRDEEATLFGALDRDPLVIASPVEFRSDRTMRLTLLGPGADLQEALADLPDTVAVEVRAVSEFGGTSADVLTDRQQTALGVAWEVGYYDVPRGDGVEVVADRLDSSVANVSTLLRRAEQRLVARALNRDR